MKPVKTDHYQRRIDALKDERAKARIESGVLKLCCGNASDSEPVGAGVSELRIHYGPCYRVYYKMRGREMVVLLLAGTKKRQQRDIELAKEIASSIGL